MDLSTIGIKFGWAVEATAGTKPTSFTWIPRCNKIAGITVTREKIDVSCFEDTIKKYIAGVGDTGGDWTVNFNGSKKFIDRWNSFLAAYEEAAENGLAAWANVFIPGFGSYFIKMEPCEIPMSDLEVNNKLDMQMGCVINEYMGLGEAIEPQLAAGDTED